MKYLCMWFLNLYVSAFPGIHDRKEVLEVARNADYALRTFLSLLNPTSFESTKAFFPSSSLSQK